MSEGRCYCGGAETEGIVRRVLHLVEVQVVEQGSGEVSTHDDLLDACEQAYYRDTFKVVLIFHGEQGEVVSLTLQDVGQEDSDWVLYGYEKPVGQPIRQQVELPSEEETKALFQ